MAEAAHKLCLKINELQKSWIQQKIHVDERKAQRLLNIKIKI